jgi:hypothetical protein
MCWSQPLVDGRYQGGCLVADRELVVPRGHGTVPFETIDAALDRVPSLVVLRVELRRTAAAGAAFPSVAGLVGLVRDGAANATSAQLGAVLPGGVRLISAHPPRPGARSAGPQPGHPDAAQDNLELRGVPALPGGDHDGHGLLPLLDGEVQLGGQAAARAPEAVVVGLDCDTAGRLLLQVPLFLAPAACWWARQTVESTLRSQVIRSLASARAWSSVKMRCQVPLRCQRRNRSYARPHGPYSAGMSRHGMPVRTRNRMPSISCRRVHIGGRPGFLPFGNSSSSTAHCSSVRSPRATNQDHLTPKIHFRHRP